MTSASSLWALCLGRLEHELPENQFNTWIRPLQAVLESGQLTLLAPNRFVKDRIEKDYLDDIVRLVKTLATGKVAISVGVGGEQLSSPRSNLTAQKTNPQQPRFDGRLNPALSF